MYLVIENVEYRDRPGATAVERVLGRYATADEAREAGRAAWREFESRRSLDFAWFMVKQDGARLAEWIADSRSDQELVLDLRSGQLVPLI